MMIDSALSNKIEIVVVAVLVIVFSIWMFRILKIGSESSGRSKRFFQDIENAQNRLDKFSGKKILFIYNQEDKRARNLVVEWQAYYSRTKGIPCEVSSQANLIFNQGVEIKEDSETLIVKLFFLGQ